MPRDLLSDHVGFVVCLGFEAAVVGPEVDGIADASDTALVDLHMSARFDMVFRLIVLTISAASGPAIANSMSAYVFQKPWNRGYLARNRSYASRVEAIACGLELRFRPPSCASAARTSFSQCSNSSGSAACDAHISL